ncbi:MAG: hypothetical protein ABJC12_05315 [Saprospiraceae bacterium]
MSKFFKDVILFDSEEKKLGIASMSGVEWKPVTVIFRIDTLGQGGMSTINKYFYFLDNTNYDYHMHLVTADVSILEGEYNYEKDTFSLLVKIIPKAIGTYFLRQGSNTGQDGNQIFHGKCNGNNVDAWVDMNKFQNNNDNNIELLTESPDTFFNSWVLSNRATNIDHFGGFCFRVIP